MKLANEPELAGCSIATTMVFDHVNDAIESEEHGNLRLDTIRKILGRGLKPIHVVHRQGMSPEEARLAEAVLRDAFPGLTNIQAGEGWNDYGPANAEELARRYGSSVIQFEQGRKILVVKTKWVTVESRTRRAGVAEHDGIYEAARGYWRVSRERAERADHVLAVIDGICRGVYVPEEWKPSSHSDWPDRWEFDGRKADEETWRRYVGKRLPDRLRKKGMASPVLYEGY